MNIMNDLREGAGQVQLAHPWFAMNSTAGGEEAGERFVEESQDRGGWDAA